VLVRGCAEWLRATFFAVTSERVTCSVVFSSSSPVSNRDLNVVLRYSAMTLTVRTGSRSDSLSSSYVGM